MAGKKRRKCTRMANSNGQRFAMPAHWPPGVKSRIIAFGMGHSPGGFRVWWRALTGSDDTLDNAHLMRLAGRFSRRVRGYAKAHGIPVIDCAAGQRKHDVADDYLAKATVTEGLFLVLVGRAQAAVWHVEANYHLERKKCSALAQARGPRAIPVGLAPGGGRSGMS